MKTTKFRLNKKEVDEGEGLDSEYLATESPNLEDMTLVSWIDESGDYHQKHYDTSDVEFYFEKNIWIEII